MHTRFALLTRHFEYSRGKGSRVDSTNIRHNKNICSDTTFPLPKTCVTLDVYDNRATTIQTNTLHFVYYHVIKRPRHTFSNHCHTNLRTIRTHFEHNKKIKKMKSAIFIALCLMAVLIAESSVIMMK